MKELDNTERTTTHPNIYAQEKKALIGCLYKNAFSFYKCRKYHKNLVIEMLKPESDNVSQLKRTKSLKGKSEVLMQINKYIFHLY